VFLRVASDLMVKIAKAQKIIIRIYYTRPPRNDITLELYKIAN
jgi:hypothetical protein